MKKNRSRVALLLLTTFILLSLNTPAQIFTRRLPKSWTAKAEGVERIAWFHLANPTPGAKSKDRIFQDKIKTPEYPHLFYSIDGINELLKKLGAIPESFNSVNVYITLFRNFENCSANLPHIDDDKIVLVFTPANRGASGVKDIKRYFIIGPDNKCYEIEEKCLQDWSSNYVTKLIDGADGLVSTILDKTENHCDKQNHCKDNKLSDTRSIVYDYDNFKEFLEEERAYQDRKFDKVTGIQVNFSQFTDKGDPNAKPGQYQYRLTLQFEFTKAVEGKNEVFYIDDQRNFLRRRKKSDKEEQRLMKKEKAKIQLLGRNSIKTFNHGELCPQVCD
jgi:hypothetical protein